VRAAIAKGWETRRANLNGKKKDTVDYTPTFSKLESKPATTIQAKAGSTITITISVS
jgi:hypothetical protein